MSLNSIRPVGDDQEWKAEVERVIAELRQQIILLQSQLNSKR